MTMSVSTFFVFAALGMILSAFGVEMSNTYMEILDMTVPPLLTIIGAVFAVEGVGLFANRKTKKEVSDAVEKKMSEDPSASMHEIE
ncbi:hypothetical protein NCCP2716_01090 [Sporosarcina sp. NCCP-2716]|uniref:hypothetical protein n=1 Tax=Sporosarcina sp. NCCP-2716 TaxID=2943679 RepID=UPI00203D2988|nr:hypothetical protein [Sporosarcina sp. NCCP-2716]GKV67611.1 hypothetical protein NCCP2716_01090 [Sporosarcina sp. NCCP-2716]